MRNVAKYLNPGNRTVNNSTYPSAAIKQSKLIHRPRSFIRSLHHATSTIPIKLLARGGTSINAFPGISTNPICVIIPGIKYTNERFGMRMHMYKRAYMYIRISRNAGLMALLSIVFGGSGQSPSLARARATVR